MTERPNVLLIDTTDRVRTLTLNRPQARNALSRSCAPSSFAALRDAEADDAVDVVILTGADPVFCAASISKNWATPPNCPTSPPSGRPCVNR